MGKAAFFAAIMVVSLLAYWAQAGVSLVKNGSFESDGILYDFGEKAPQHWCDVNVPTNKFNAWIGTDGSTHGDYALTLSSYSYVIFDAGDMATVSQQVYLTDVNEIIFDVKLDTTYDDPWDPSKRSAVLLIDDDPVTVVWEPNMTGSDLRGEYQGTYTVEEKYKDANPHKLSLGIRANVEEDSSIDYRARWDFVKFDTHCGGFGYLPEDLNHDCYVDMLDLKMLAEEWLAEEPAYNCDLLADDEGIVNLRDFAIFASFWRDNNCRQSGGCGGSDFDRSRTVDSADLMIFAEYWLEPVVTLLSDLNTDRVVNFKDVAIFANGWLDNTDWNNWQDDNCFEIELPAGDIDDSGEVYYGDILMLADNWLSEGKCIRADINEDGVVNFLDFAIIADEWLLRNWLYGLK